MSEPIALEFINVSKSFGPGKSVVRNLSFHVKKGEFFSILGPSGCGKTTCLRMISGLETPTSGTVKMAGQIVNNVDPNERNVHTVFQKYALFPHLNVFENVAFGLRMQKLPENQITERVERMLQMVRLQDYAKRTIQQLSGGEQQRVALVRALVNEPEILLLDEPLAALDLKLREQMQQELVTLQKKLGTTFIFVTHDQGEALTLSDRVAIMNKGNIEQVGTPTEVYEQPATIFVAKFVGTTNVFTGTLAAGAADPQTVGIATQGFGTLYARVDGSRPVPALGAAAGLVVRPEKIRVRVTAPATNASASGATATPATIPFTFDRTKNQAAASGPEPTQGATQAAQPAQAAQPTPQPATATATPPVLNVLRGVLIERIYFGPTTQIKLQIQENLPPIIALVANQTATKMPQLKLGDRYYAVWDASDSVLVGTDGEPAQQVNDPIRVDPTDSDSGRNGKTASSKPSTPTSVEKPQALRSRLARQT